MDILLTIAYDGTKYNGWQRQQTGMGVQQKVEEGLAALYKRPVSIIGASRTDAGVHAQGQRGLYNCPNSIPLDKIPYALNALLPEDIVIRKAESAADGFHPIFHAKNKTYRYTIQNQAFKDPLLLNYSWHIQYPLCLDKMEKAAEAFIGEHDFSAFCASGSGAKTRVRTINSMKVTADGHIITILVNGNGFLYNMVRIITGTLVYVGSGKIDTESIPTIIQSKCRGQAGITAPPQGLTLMEIIY